MRFHLKHGLLFLCFSDLVNKSDPAGTRNLFETKAWRWRLLLCRQLKSNPGEHEPSLRAVITVFGLDLLANGYVFGPGRPMVTSILV